MPRLNSKKIADAIRALYNSSCMMILGNCHNKIRRVGMSGDVFPCYNFVLPTKSRLFWPHIRLCKWYAFDPYHAFSFSLTNHGKWSVVQQMLKILKSSTAFYIL